ncbi:EGFR adapter protein-like isoform X1 [Zophobas morio]
MPEGFPRTFSDIQYMGSFSVAASEQISRSEFVRDRLQQMLGNSRKKYVLLVISLAGIKVCSPDGKIVHMAHALRRISYATCDPEHRLFSFFAREPKGHFNQQYCHSFISRSSEQAEELNSIVGNAFRMAYAAQLQKQPTFQDVIASQLDQTQTNKVLWTKELSVTLKKDKSAQPPNNHQPADMDVELTNSDASTLRLAPPTTIPGLKPSHKYNVLGPSEKPQSQQSTPSSDESNSPTEMNSYKRMTEKPPLIKRIAMGLTGNHHDNDDDSCPLVSDSNSTPGSPTNRPLSGGYVNESNDADSRNLNKTNAMDSLKNEIVENINSNLTKHIEIDNSRLLQNSPASAEQEFKSKRISQISSSSSSSCPQTGLTPTPPPLPERTDSLNNKEEGELRTAPWFQAGIPREIALEILAQEPVGAFMVRESTSKPGCFALSLRVPRSFQPTGIAHYLIVRTNKGYKIKGFTKEFTTLTSLITHHSVMPELLPCPLSLSRYNPSFVKSDSKRDFADIDLDPDYNTLADFRKMMADLNV